MFIASNTSESAVVRPRAALQIMEWVRSSSVQQRQETTIWVNGTTRNLSGVSSRNLNSETGINETIV